MFKLFPDENVEPVQPKEVIPLPELLRPQSLEDVIGQSHLLGEGKPLRLSFQSGKPHAMIFWDYAVRNKSIQIGLFLLTLLLLFYIIYYLL